LEGRQSRRREALIAPGMRWLLRADTSVGVHFDVLRIPKNVFVTSDRVRY
jgi:hypothetical protein